MRLRTSLFSLVLATAIPLVAFALLSASLLYQHEYQNYVTALKDRNRAFMAAVDTELRASITTLNALAASRSLAAGDLRAFHEDAARILASQPNWINVILVGPDGRHLVNAFVPWGTLLLARPQQPESLLQAVETRQPTVGTVLSGGPFQKRPGIPVRVPVVRNGTVAYVLTAILKPESFDALIRSQRLPEGWVSGLVDADGQLIARLPSKPAGTLAGEAYRAAVRGADEGWYRGLTVEGLDTYTAFVVSEFSRWSVGYAIPAGLVHQSVRRAAWLLGGGALLTLLLAIAVALWLSRRISGPMADLAAAADLLGTEHASTAVKSDINEVRELSRALNKASEAIQVREAELRRKASELQRADANKSQFLALLSHELRNPLAPLLNGLTLLKLRNDPETVGVTQAMMERQIEQLRRLIDDLLDVSRIDRGKLELQRERVSLAGIVRTAIETAKPNIEQRSHQLTVRYSAAPLFVDGDPVRLGQVLANLLNNAAKFTPPGGRIEIDMRGENGEAVVAVTDDGIGFNREQSERIFDMFVQLDASRSHSAGGLGLGLTLVRSLVEMHGGRISASSPGPDRGAQFAVRLPLVAAPAAMAQAEIAMPAQRRGRVLVVDDNADAADSLAQILRVEGFEVRACYDARQALEAIPDFNPGIAFIDLNMPGLDGIDLAKRIRGQAWGREVKLVALTGMGQKADYEATRAAGFAAHLTKPAAFADVLRLAAGEEGDNVVSLRGERRA